MPSQIDNRPIIDAKHPLTLHITKADIGHADPKEPMNCAAARNLRREHKVEEARIHLRRVYIRQNKGNWQRYETPDALRNEIIAFDRGGAFEPGEYTLIPPPPSHRANGKRQGSRDTTKLGGVRRAGGKRRRTGPPRKSPTIVKNVRGGPAT